MKIIAALILVLLLAPSVRAEELCQFKDIPFGTPKAEVLARLDFRNKGAWQSANSYFFTTYKLGDRPVTLSADFDDNDRFFRFVFTFKSYGPDDDGVKLIKADFAYLATLFADKYGPPATTNPVDKLKLAVIDKPAPLQEWHSGRCRAYVGIGNDFQRFNATAAVYDADLLAAQTARRENRKQDNLNRAVRDF